MANQGFYIEDWDALDSIADAKEAEAAAWRGWADDLRADFHSKAAGLEGTKTAVAMHEAAEVAYAKANAQANEFAETARRYRASAAAYRAYGKHGSNDFDPAAHIWLNEDGTPK